MFSCICFCISKNFIDVQHNVELMANYFRRSRHHPLKHLVDKTLCRNQYFVLRTFIRKQKPISLPTTSEAFAGGFYSTVFRVPNGKVVKLIDKDKYQENEFVKEVYFTIYCSEHLGITPKVYTAWQGGGLLLQELKAYESLETLSLQDWPPFENILKVVELLHQHFIVHGDLCNFTNIMVHKRTKQVKLIDFGKAKHTRSSTKLQKERDNLITHFLFKREQLLL